MADQFDEVATAILQAFEASGKVHDQVFSADPLFALLNAKGKKETLKGGKEIQVNLRYAKNTTGQSYAGWDQLERTPMETIGHALFPWAQYAINISIDEATILKDSSKEAIVNLVTDKTQEAMDSLQDIMTVDLYGDGTGNGGKDLLGLKAIVSGTGTLGGIDRATYTWWQAQVKNVAGPVDTSWMGNFTHTCRGPSGDPQKEGKVDLILNTQLVYEAFEGLLEPYLRIDARSRAGNGLLGGELGFDALRYKGADLTWSPNMPAGEQWYISTEYMGLRVMQGRDFAFTPFEKTLVAGQDGRTAWILWMGNMIASQCRRLGRAYGITT